MKVFISQRISSLLVKNLDVKSVKLKQLENESLGYCMGGLLFSVNLQCKAVLL